MNKQEILEEINKTKEHLANMKKMLAEYEYGRWKPEKGETYYSISEIGSIIETCDLLGTIAETRGNFYNIFRTREQAKIEAEKILVRRMLEDIARRLNKGKKIDWLGDTLNLFTICYDFDSDKIGLTSTSALIKKAGEIYCLNREFAHVAIQEIGEERLKKYLRGE